jgi:hypothetical protein
MMNAPGFLLTPAFLLLLATPLGAGESSQLPEGPSGAESEVLEAALWYRMANNISGITLLKGDFVRKTTGEPTNLVVCVMLKRKQSEALEPAPMNFLSRFTGVPAITRGSRCTANLAGDYETSSHAPAIIFFAGPVRWVEKDRAEVIAGYHMNGLAAQWCKHELRLNSGAWIINQMGPCKVS